MTRHILVILAIAVFTTAMALIILQNVLGPGAPTALRGYDQGYADGFRAARSQLDAANLTTARSSLTGEVTDISDSSISIRVRGLLMDERVDGAGPDRTVIVTNDTLYIVAEMLPFEEFEALQASFARALQSGNSPLDPPLPHREVAGTMENLAIGDTVIVTGINDQNILRESSFTASKIVVRKLATDDIATP